MSKLITVQRKPLSLVLSALTLTMANGVSAADSNLEVFAENASYYRDEVGLSKFRNTLQLEFESKFSSNLFRSISVNAIIRGTYDGVYDMNDDEFGEDVTYQYLGEDWHSSDVSSPVILTPGVAVPCENDTLLCHNLDGYMDQDSNDIRYPDFNDSYDFIRELYVTADTVVGGDDILSFRLGKQQVVWGKTDLFRVLDVINPVDYSRHNIYDELEDIRIPQWMLKVDWRMGANKVFDDSNFQLVWNFDEFRPSNLGTCGQSYRILDAGCFFSSYVNASYLNAVLGSMGLPALYAGNVPIIHDVEEPDWNLSNTQVGLKWEGVYGDATFSLNALTYRQQLPSLHFRPFAEGLPIPAADGVFDIVFPRVNLLGGAIDYYSMAADAVWRVEFAYTEGEELARDTDGHKETEMARYVIGLDKNLVIPALGTQSAFLISVQLFGEHILDFEKDMPNEEDNWIATMLFKGFYINNRLSPQIILAHDVGGKATAIAPSISYLSGNHWLFNLGLNIKTGGDETFPWTVAGGASVTEPLSRFTNGPIGVANNEDEVQLTIRYSF
ncbi:DUF1302 family protein [Halioxenophilus sp. WMMB6]|uniref:DUF1302 family protein n=1 Tax=Halioxenophilus sp. WMMB6 TaxID=3073815 RepID=UPI00295F058E|nr:DUF1302 family protein [Halioxenophilus sp. WMMB6]